MKEELKIIIADDNKAIAELMKRYIEENSEFRILDIATSSKEQIELMDKHSIDIILTDIMRKNEDISGLDIILESAKNNRKEKFILITASPKQEIIMKYDYEKPTNIIAYLKKPFDFKNIIDELEKAKNTMKEEKINIINEENIRIKQNLLEKIKSYFAMV